jgi:phenol hydroxylase P0 protein
MSEVNANNRWVRVTRETGTGFVEFEFFVSDTDLCVELILPAPAFKEFCAMNKVRFIEADGTDSAPPTEPGNLLRRIK